ncbi:formate dehydrogenase subunit alpha [Litorilituus sediminis]|uniref:Formate dehydrogenase subunit alpha n=1 Tax=Litorilituus sediminis TaxID=718192 RepID=A0A4P6P4V1_9GAMM|nr:formate dehydrogenase subunit alpha [Litorilituus sediminis]QBG34437.1 formate dehydrogenase subunit alpha [Litorilituus sediminis]
MSNQDITNSKTAFLNGVAYPIEQGESILAFSRRVQTSDNIPTLCDDSRLEPYGSCRVCSVDVALTADGPRRVMASCHTPISDGMHVFSHSQRIEKLRKNIVELVLSDLPEQQLPIEPSAHTTEFEQVVLDTGVTEVRFAKGKQSVDSLPKNSDGTVEDSSHPYMRMDLSQCIDCNRCVRACDEIQGEQVLSVSGRGFDARIIKGQDVSFDESDCVSCGACAQTCPTGAITDVFRQQLAKTTINESQPLDTVRTVCSYCGVGCNLEVSVQDNKIISIQAPKDAEVNAGHTCLKGRYAWRFYNHPDRLTSPLVRINGELTPVSWQYAYDYLANKMLAIKAEHGADALAGISSARCTNEENYLLQKMMRVVLGTNNIDCCARVCHSPTAYGMQQSFGTGAATNSIEDLKQTEFILLIGANPTAAHPVTGAKIKQKAMKGTPLIVIDPVKTELARFANWHIQLRPGTNVAVLNMMAYYIISEKVFDTSFVENRTEEFDAYKAAILALDMDELASIADVDKHMVKEAAIAYAKANNAMSFHGLGVTEHSQGSRAIMCIADLVMLTGNIGRKGVGMNPLRGQNNVQGAADMGCQPHQGAGYLDVTQAENIEYYQSHYQISDKANWPVNIGYKIPEMFNAALAGELKALWIMGEDVVQTDPNQKHVVASLSNLELLVVQEIFLSETAKMADVVLPGSSFLEKDGTFTNGERRVQKVNAAVPPKAGCKTDGQIVVDMMNALGYAQADYSADTMLEEISQVVPFFAGITWQNLGDNGLQWPVAKDGTDTKILHADSFTRGLGKFHFYEFEESQEVLSHGEAFPFILTTSRNLEHYNAGTMTRRTANERIVSEDVLLINPEDAKQKAIEDRSKVRLFSARGEIELTAEVSDKVNKGILFTTFHFPELMINRVTGDITDKHTKCPEYKVVSVGIEPVI